MKTPLSRTNATRQCEFDEEQAEGRTDTGLGRREEKGGESCGTVLRQAARGVCGKQFQLTRWNWNRTPLGDALSTEGPSPGCTSVAGDEDDAGNARASLPRRAFHPLPSSSIRRDVLRRPRAEISCPSRKLAKTRQRTTRRTTTWITGGGREGGGGEGREGQAK